MLLKMTIYACAFALMLNSTTYNFTFILIFIVKIIQLTH